MAEQPAGDEVKLLSGGNLRVAKADGDGPVQAYITGAGKVPDSRWVHIYEGELDKEQMVEWM